MIKLKDIRHSRYLFAAAVIILVTVAAVFLSKTEKTALTETGGRTFEKGIVTKIISDNVQEDGIRVGEQTVEVRMTTGSLKGKEIRATSSAGYLFGTACYPGTHVVVIQSVAGRDVVSSIYSRDRGYQLLMFAMLYFAVLCLIGGKQGLHGTLSLIITFVSIIYIYLPLVYLGYPPFWTAVLICAVITVISFILISGITRKSLVAALGTLAGIIIAGIMASFFSAVTGITGYNVSNIETLITLWDTNDIQVGGLLFSGILISSLGAVMDVAMSVSSSMEEIVRQNPAISRSGLFQAGMRIGRDMMGTDSNTLILAFAGSSLSMLILDYAYDLPVIQIINSNNIGLALMEGLSGSFGVVLSMPATAVMAAWVYTAAVTDRDV
jgi:uncharacterized membrane protein